MTTFEAYKLYLALRLHFTSNDYDLRKTKGKIRASEKALEKNVKLQFQLEKLKKKYSEGQFVNLLVANFIEGERWGGIYDLPEAEERYTKWQARIESMTYLYQRDLESLRNSDINSLSELLDCSDGHPILLKWFLGGKLNVETLVILNKLYKFNETVSEKLVLDPIWKSVSMLIYKYSPFVKIDKEKFNTLTRRIIDA